MIITRIVFLEPIRKLLVVLVSPAEITWIGVLPVDDF